MILRRLDPSRVAVHLAAHESRLRELHRSGVVLYAGPFAEGGGLTLFQAPTRADAERFVAEDPFVMHETHQAELLAWNPWLTPRNEGESA